MSLDCSAESFFCSFHEVATATTMDVDFNTAGNNIHTLCVNNLCANYCKVTVCNFKNLVIAHDNRTVLQPALRGQDLAIDDLLKHNICS